MAAALVAGGLIGLELMHLLAGVPPATQELALVLDVRTLEVRREPVARDPRCDACKYVE
jgi:hypothetical protein